MMASASAGLAKSRRWIRTESASSSPISARQRCSYSPSRDAEASPDAIAAAATSPAWRPVTMA